mgnify:CR=1 FL=1
MISTRLYVCIYLLAALFELLGAESGLEFLQIHGAAPLGIEGVEQLVKVLPLRLCICTYLCFTETLLTMSRCFRSACTYVCVCMHTSALLRFYLLCCSASARHGCRWPTHYLVLTAHYGTTHLLSTHLDADCRHGQLPLLAADLA